MSTIMDRIYHDTPRSTKPTTLQIVAKSCAQSLRDALAPSCDRDTRALQYDDARTAMAHAITEDVTGISRAQSRLVSLYPHRDLTPEQVRDARIYNDALIAAFRQIDQRDYTQLMTFCEEIAGERSALVA